MAGEPEGGGGAPGSGKELLEMIEKRWPKAGKPIVSIVLVVALIMFVVYAGVFLRNNVPVLFGTHTQAANPKEETHEPALSGSSDVPVCKDTGPAVATGAKGIANSGCAKDLQTR
jgi:hypothetical protein